MSTKCPKCHTDNTVGSKFCSSCGLLLDSIDKIPISQTKTIETPAEELTTGSTFAERYQIIEELGKGGMGQKIAIKLIKPDIASDKKTIERFRNELKTARKIGHKNVCRMFDLNREKGNYYITMEFVEGGDLRRFIRRSKQLTTGTAISIAKQICDGLAEAHELGIVHRDLKPNNIMIDDNGNARIMDFGIARSIKGKSLTGSGVMIGTPEYMSPEQVEGKDVDKRSDIYSLGIILYEMTTGRTPFDGDTPFTIGVKHKSEIPKDPKEFNPQIPDDLSGVILRCLEKEKENRYKNTGELRSELEKIEKGLPTTDSQISVPRSTTSKQITVSFTPKKFLIPAVVLAALIMAVVLIWKPWSGTSFLQPSESGLPSLAVLNFKNNTGDASLDIWSQTFRDLLISDLSQSHYFRIQSGERVNQILSQLNLREETSYSADVLREIGKKAGVETIITGNFMKDGEIIRVNASLLDAESGDLVNSAKAEGQEDAGFYSLVDDLTLKIKSSFNLTKAELSSDQDMEVGVITTPYPEAYDFYRIGRTFYLKEDYESSIPIMEKAIEIDPDFAMAYRSIAMAYSNMGGNQDKVKENLSKAMEKSDRLSYLEKKIIEAQYSGNVEGDSQKALTIWEELLKDYPESNFVNNSLGVYYLLRMDIDKAIPYYEICQKNRYEFTACYVNLGEAYMIIGEYENARQVFWDHIEYFGDSASMRARLAEAYIFEGKIDKAIPEAKKAIGMNPRAFRMGVFDHLRGNFAAAEKEYEQWIDDSNINVRMDIRRWLAILNMTQGKYEKAASFIEEGLVLAKEEKHHIYELEFLMLKSWRDIALGNFVEALNEAQTLSIRASQYERSLIQLSSLLLQNLIYYKTNQSEKIQEVADLVGRQLEALDVVDRMITLIDLSFRSMADLADGNYKSAVEKLNEAWSLRIREWSWTENHIISLFYLGEANLLANDLESARKVYELGLNLTSGKIYFGDLWAKSHLRLGEVYEKLGNRDKAIEHTEKFLEMWKDADPGLLEVEDARKRLAGLK